MTADGEPRPATTARARRAAGLYGSGRAARIVMSGAYGMYDPPPPRVARWEAGLLAVSRRWFAAVRPGDDAAIAAVLARDHPVYADHPQTTLAQLAAMITRHSP